MSGPHEHPSYWDLDGVALGIAPPEVAAHARGCERCRAYVAELDAGASEPLPAWTDGLRARRRSRRGLWLGGAAVALAMAASLLVAVVPRTGPDGIDAPYVAAKGEPVVVVYLRRGAEVRRLGASERIRPGDSLRLGVIAPGFEKITVRAATPTGEAVLYSGALPSGPEGLLPASFAVDGEGNREILHLSLAPGDPRRPQWRTTLTFDKER